MTLEQTLENTRRFLLEARNEQGIWRGHLSSSPLATAVAVYALYRVDAKAHQQLITQGLTWLAQHQQADGSWGDAENLDPGYLSTTLLCYSAFHAIDPQGYRDVISKAQQWICIQTGDLSPSNISEAVYRMYGKDRTFAVPILTMCALAGVLGNDGFKTVKALPFELSILPRRLFRMLKLTVVSYALPALIAIGQVKYYHDRPSNPISHVLRRIALKPSLELLTKLQPSNGGFLEATPLTSFVTMSLAAMGHKDHPVVRKAVDFITHSVRSDGSWPIDTDLATWVTSLSVNALLSHDDDVLSDSEKQQITDWYLDQQFNDEHVFTGAAPGGWGWTDLPGSVPDADDTAGALVALYLLGIRNERVMKAAQKGVDWLLDLQNADGGIPTFCRGWGKLEFDRSCPDLTAHAIKAWSNWKILLPQQSQSRIEQAIHRAMAYLSSAQQADGSWLPLWFGNPFTESKTNPVYGTARVLSYLRDHRDEYKLQTERAAAFLKDAQNADDGWGACKAAVSTIEETAVAIEALTSVKDAEISQICDKGLRWLISHTGQGSHCQASPIGLYFAHLWYSEQLYPSIFTVLSLKNCLLVRESENTLHNQKK